MDNNELRTMLEQLHGEIEHTDSIDEKGRELLRELGEDIRELLNRTSGEKPQPTMIKRMEDSISYLEVTHPTLTSTISNLLDTLSNAGI